jgi:hypothetical protein
MQCMMKLKRNSTLMTHELTCELFTSLVLKFINLDKETLKLLKKTLQFTSQVIQIKPCGHHGKLFNKKQKQDLEDVNLMKYNLQISNIHDWIESRLNLET